MQTMEAKTFIKYYEELFKNPMEIGNDLYLLQSYYELVNQEFKPKMLLDLFEGWEYNNEYDYENKGIGIDFGIANDNTPFFYDEMRVYFPKKKPIYFKQPHTVHDFIVIMESMGYKLFWKQNGEI